MKLIKIYFAFLMLLSAGSSMAQFDKGRGQMSDSIDAIMKQKIVSNLEVDDLTADKFINVYKENKNSTRKIMKEKKDVMESLEKDPNATDIDSKIDKILQLETDMLDQKKSFFQELKTFLTPQQIAKTLVLRKRFENQFRKEVKKHRDEKRKREKEKIINKVRIFDKKVLKEVFRIVHKKQYPTLLHRTYHNKA